MIRDTRFDLKGPQEKLSGTLITGAQLWPFPGLGGETVFSFLHVSGAIKVPVLSPLVPFPIARRVSGRKRVRLYMLSWLMTWKMSYDKQTPLLQHRRWKSRAG